MLILDDILLLPARGIGFIFEEIRKAAQEESAGEEKAIRTELTELYMMLETGKITEEEFDAREKELLDRLEEIESRSARSEESAGTEDS